MVGVFPGRRTANKSNFTWELGSKMPDTINPQHAPQNKLLEALRQKSFREILNVGGVGFGLAAALRGGQGLFNMLSRGGKKLPTRAGVAPLPVKYRPSVDISEAEEEKNSILF